MEDNSIAQLGKDKLTEMTIAFNTVIENAGRWAGVYANRNWFDNYLHKDTLKQKYTTWIATYTSGTDKYKGEYDMWQNSSNGKIEGIVGNVDTNYMYRDLVNKQDGQPVEEKENKEEFEMAKTYRNGSTIENVFADTSLTNKIGNLDKYEVCECLGIVNGRYIVKYKVNGTNNYKVGFVAYNGGIQ